MPASTSDTSIIAPLTELDDAAYVELCHAQVAEAAQCVCDDIWRESRFMESFTNAFVERAATSRIFVDVGAERGFYTHLALRHMPAPNRVVAIEPDPHRAAALRRYFANADHVAIVEAAAGSGTGSVSLSKNGPHSASMRRDGGARFTVRSIVLDEIADARDADLIKIDVEGAEVVVLDGMSGILRDRRCHVYVEYHPWAEEITPDARQRIRALASRCDYQITRTDLARPDPNRLIGGRMILSPSIPPNEANQR